jgi:hypothetical protein
MRMIPIWMLLPLALVYALIALVLDFVSAPTYQRIFACASVAAVMSIVTGIAMHRHAAPVAFVGKICCAVGAWVLIDVALRFAAGMRILDIFL